GPGARMGQGVLLTSLDRSRPRIAFRECLRPEDRARRSRGNFSIVRRCAALRRKTRWPGATSRAKSCLPKPIGVSAMSLASYLALAVAVFILALTPGPVVVATVARSLFSGLGASIAFV